MSMPVQVTGPAQARGPTPNRRQSNRPVVLLVEDNPSDADLAREAFAGGRYECELHHVNDGQAALDFVRKQGEYATAPTPDLILLDLNLPGLDGRSVLATIKRDSALRRIPVVVFSSSSAPDDVYDAYELRANAFVTKPVGFRQYHNTIRAIERFWIGRAMAPQIRILVVEDNPADAAIIGDYFEETRTEPAAGVVERVDRLQTALARLAEQHHDVVLLDLSLPDARGLEGLTAITTAYPRIPVVVMTGLTDARVALEAVKAGAQDYLSKGVDGARVVRRAVLYAIERHRLQRELTELLASERAARAAAERSSKARDELMSIVSHDLRNPLSAIAISASALPSSPPQEAARLAKDIARSSEWALHIIRDLVDVSVIEAGRLTIYTEPMTLWAIIETIESIFEPQARAVGVRFRIDMEEAPRWIVADVDRLVQALGNLVSNAIKFTPSGGMVSLKVYTGPGPLVSFAVADTGPGISPDHVPHIFDRFWHGRTSLKGGAGLGLAIARGIAEGHGGRIDVESTEGIGSTFTLRIPVGG